MTLDDLPTPCLVLDLGILKANLARMQAAVARHPGLTLRPHMKTAKSLAVADLAAPGKGPITVSTVAEARYFAGGGFNDQIYAVGITPAKLDAIAALNAQGADVKVITDDLDVAAAIAAHQGRLRALVEVDCGEGRGGVTPDGELLTEIAGRLGARCVGVMTHAGHSYNERSIPGVAAVAETEHRGAALAAERLRAAGIAVEVVSLGSSPTALYGKDMAGITDVRAGVYMFGDLFQGTDRHAWHGRHCRDGPIRRHRPQARPQCGAGGCRRHRAVEGPVHREGTEGLRLRPDARQRRQACLRRSHRRPHPSGAWGGPRRSRIAVRPAADRRAGAHRTEPHLPDGRGA
jgi:hypothetical protein